MHPSEPAIDPTQKPLDAMRCALAPYHNEDGLRFAGIGTFSPSVFIERAPSNPLGIDPLIRKPDYRG